MTIITIGRITISAVYAVTVFIGLVVQLTKASSSATTSTHRDNAYYPAGTYNPLVNNEMYWRDARNILQDLSKFESIHVKYDGCVWSPASLDYSYYSSDNDDNDNNQNNGSNDVWYSGIVPREEANVAFTLYGKLKTNKGRGSNGCNSQHYINSFYTAAGLDTFLQAMATARVQRFDKYSSSGSSYISAYSGTCNDGYGVSCTDKGNFAIFKYGISELASQSTCHADTRQSLSENLQQLNNDLHAGAKCVEIYNDSVQGSSIDTSDVTGTAISLLSYSTACKLGDPVKGCPDPYAKLKFNEKTYKRATTLRNKTRDFRIRIFKSFCLFALGAVMIYFAYRIYKREEDYVEHDKSLFQRYFKPTSNHDSTLDSSTGHKLKNETTTTGSNRKMKKDSKKKRSSRSSSPAGDRRNRDRSLLKPERNDRNKPNPDDADGGYYVAMEAGDAPSIRPVSSIRTSEGKEEIYDGPAFDEVSEKSVMILDLDYEIESVDEADVYDEEEDDDDEEVDLEKVTGVSSMKNRRQGILPRPKRRDEAPWNVFEAAIRRIAMRRRKGKDNSVDNSDKSDPLLESEHNHEIQMINVKIAGSQDDPIDPADISTPTRSAQVTKRNNIILRIGRWMKHKNREREIGLEKKHQTEQVEVDNIEANSTTEKVTEQKAIPADEQMAKDVNESNPDSIPESTQESTPESTPVEDRFAYDVVETNPIKIPVEAHVARDTAVIESNLEPLVDNRTAINGTSLPNTVVPIILIVDGAAGPDASGDFKSIEKEKETEQVVQPVASAISKESSQSNASNVWGGLDSGRSCDSVAINTAKAIITPIESSTNAASERAQVEDAFENEQTEDRQSGSALVAAVGAVAALATTTIGMQQASNAVTNATKSSGEAEDIAAQRQEASKGAPRIAKRSGEAGDIAAQRQQESKTATKTTKSSGEAGDIAAARKQASKAATSITKSSGETGDIASQRQQASTAATSITKISGKAGDMAAVRQQESKAATRITKSTAKAGDIGAQRPRTEPLKAETVVIRNGSTTPQLDLSSKGSGVKSAPVMSDDDDTSTDTDTDTDSESKVRLTDRDISPASSAVSCAGSFQESIDSHEPRNAIVKQWLEQRPRRENEAMERKVYSITASDVSYAPSLDESYREEPVKSSYVTILPPIPASSVRSAQSAHELNVNIPVANEEIELRGNACQPPFCGDSTSEDSFKNQNAPENLTSTRDDREDASQFLFQSSFHRDSSDNSDSAAPNHAEQSLNNTLFAPLSGFKKFLYPRKGETDMAVTSKVKGSKDSKRETSVRSYIANLTVDPEISPEIDTDEFNQPTPKTQHVTRRDLLRPDFSADSSETDFVTSASNTKSINPTSTSRNAENDKVSMNDDIATDLTPTNSYMSNVLPTSSWSLANPFKGLAIAIASADAAEAEWNATKIKELMSIPEQEVEEEAISAGDSKTPIQDDLEGLQYEGDLLNALEDALSPNASFDGDRVPAPTSSITDDDGDAPLLPGLFQNSTDFLESALAMMPKMLSRAPSVLSTPPNPVSPRRASFTVFQQRENDNHDNDCDRSHQTSPYNLQTGISNTLDDEVIPGVEVEIDEELSHAPPVREIRRTGSNDVMSLISYEYSYQTDDDNSTLKSKVRSRVHDERDTHENDERKMTTNKKKNAVSESREAVEASGGGVDTTHNVNNESPKVSSSKPPLYKSKSIFNKIGFGRKSKA